MNKKPSTWEELDIELTQEDLKKTKSGSIAFIKDKDKLNRWDIYHAHWETYLASHAYWKNWQEKINSFQTEKEVNFYTDRLRAFIDFVEENTRKEVSYVTENSPKQRDPETTPRFIEHELKRLESISEEEFNKTDKWSKSGSKWEKVSVEEALNDPWFSKQIDNIFGPEKENGKVFSDKKEKDSRKNSSVEKETSIEKGNSPNLKKSLNNEKLTEANGKKEDASSEINFSKVNDSLSRSKNESCHENDSRVDKKIIWGGVGIVSLLGLLVGLMVIKVKKIKKREF